MVSGPLSYWKGRHSLTKREFWHTPWGSFMAHIRIPFEYDFRTFLRDCVYPRALGGHLLFRNFCSLILLASIARGWGEGVEERGIIWKIFAKQVFPAATILLSRRFRGMKSGNIGRGWTDRNWKVSSFEKIAWPRYESFDFEVKEIYIS